MAKRRALPPPKRHARAGEPILQLGGETDAMAGRRGSNELVDALSGPSMAIPGSMAKAAGPVTVPTTGIHNRAAARWFNR